MPRTEARIFTSIWKDPDFLALSPGAQRLYMFLLSQDDLAYCGLMPLRPARWARKAKGLTLPEIERDLKELEGTAYPSPNPDEHSARTPFVIADRDTEELLIRTLMRRDGVWKQPNLLKQARDSADQAESPTIRAALVAELHRLPLEETSSEQVKTLVADFIADLDQGTAYPPDYPSPNPPGNPSDDPTAEDHACARGLGEGYEGNQRVSPDPHSPSPISPAAPRADRKTGTRLADDFAVTAEMVAWARDNAPHVDGRRETERFRDHWRGKPGKDGRKLDWVATWRNWMRTAEDRQGPRDRPSPRQQHTDNLFDEAMAEARALDAQESSR